MKRQLSATVLLVGIALFGAQNTANAQLNPFAPTDAMDTLNSGPVGGGDAFGGAIGRANNVVGQVNAAPDPFGGGGAAAASPFGADPGSPFGADPANPFGGPPAGGGQFTGGFALPAFEPRLTALGGERIVCRRSRQILQDAREINILQSQVGSYYDDGVQGNDAVANDQIYTNIIESDNFISPESHLVKTRLIQTIRYASQLAPNKLFPERVATTEPLSSLPKMVDLEMRQDKLLREWLDDFLVEYRLDPDKLDSEFVPTFLPPPPRAPRIPLPATFTAIAGATAGTAPQAPGVAGGGGGEFLDAGEKGVTGEPVGAASSRYF